jgi:hypothetical protein
MVWKEIIYAMEGDSLFVSQMYGLINSRTFLCISSNNPSSIRPSHVCSSSSPTSATGLHNYAHIITLGAFLWAAATFLIAISGTFQVGFSAVLIQFDARKRSRCDRWSLFFVWL